MMEGLWRLPRQCESQFLSACLKIENAAPRSISISACATCWAYHAVSLDYISSFCFQGIIFEICIVNFNKKLAKYFT